MYAGKGNFARSGNSRKSQRNIMENDGFGGHPALNNGEESEIIKSYLFRFSQHNNESVAFSIKRNNYNDDYISNYLTNKISN